MPGAAARPHSLGHPGRREQPAMAFRCLLPAASPVSNPAACSATHWLSHRSAVQTLPRLLDGCTGAPRRCRKSCSVNSYNHSMLCHSTGRAAWVAVPLPRGVLLFPLQTLLLLNPIPCFSCIFYKSLLAKANQDRFACRQVDAQPRPQQRCCHMSILRPEQETVQNQQLRCQPPLNHISVPALRCTLRSDAVTAGHRVEHLILRSLFLPCQCHQGAPAFPPRHVGSGQLGTATLQG